MLKIVKYFSFERKDWMGYGRSSDRIDYYHYHKQMQGQGNGSDTMISNVRYIYIVLDIGYC